MGNFDLFVPMFLFSLKAVRLDIAKRIIGAVKDLKKLKGCSNALGLTPFDAAVHSGSVKVLRFLQSVLPKEPHLERSPSDRRTFGLSWKDRAHLALLSDSVEMIHEIQSLFKEQQTNLFSEMSDTYRWFNDTKGTPLGTFIKQQKSENGFKFIMNEIEKGNRARKSKMWYLFGRDRQTGECPLLEDYTDHNGAISNLAQMVV